MTNTRTTKRSAGAELTPAAVVEWQCSRCTLLNPGSHKRCSACRKGKPKPSTTGVAEAQAWKPQAAAGVEGWQPQEWTGGGTKSGAGKNRVCFQMRFNTDTLPEYLADHSAVWPEMQQALIDCGWHNYSLFYRNAHPSAISCIPA